MTLRHSTHGHASGAHHAWLRRRLRGKCRL